MKRKIISAISLIIASAMLFAVASCGKEDEQTSAGENIENAEVSENAGDSSEIVNTDGDENADGGENDANDDTAVGEFAEGTEEAETEETEEIENLPTQPVENENDVVYEYINVVRNVKPDLEGLDFGEVFTSSFSIPQIKVESENAKAFNEKILSHYPALAFETDFTEEPVPTPYVCNYSYACDVTDRGYIAVVVIERLGYYYSEGYTTYKALYYDLKNDCEATSSEYLSSVGLDFEKIKEDTQKMLYIKAARGDLDDSSYNLDYIKDYPKIGGVAIRSENEGFVSVDVSGYAGYRFIDIPVDGVEYQKAKCIPGTTVYQTPAFEADIVDIFLSETQVNAVTKAALPEYMATVEYDEEYEWYAIEFNGVYGYVLAEEIIL